MIATRLVSLRLADMIEAIARIRRVLDGMSPDAFQQDWAKRWLVERGMTILI